MLRRLAIAAITGMGLTSLTVVFGGREQPRRDSASDDANPTKLLDGKWKAVELHHNGQPAPTQVLDIAGYIIENSQLVPTINGKRRGDSISFTIDDTKHPKQIDLVESDSGEKSIGIFELERDTLKLTVVKRPKKLTGKPTNTAVTFMVLERVQ